MLQEKLSTDDYNKHIAAIGNTTKHNELKLVVNQTHTDCIDENDDNDDQNVNDSNQQSDSESESSCDSFSSKEHDIMSKPFNDIKELSEISMNDSSHVTIKDNRSNEFASIIGSKTISLFTEIFQYLDVKYNNDIQMKTEKETGLNKELIARQSRKNDYLFLSNCNIPKHLMSMYEQIMGKLRLMHTMITRNTPIYQFDAWAETIGNFGGIPMQGHTSTTSATDLLLTLGETQHFFDKNAIKHARTVCITLDSQSNKHNSWMEFLSHIRNQRGNKEIIFTYGEYAIKKENHTECKIHNDGVNDDNNADDGNNDGDTITTKKKERSKKKGPSFKLCKDYTSNQHYAHNRNNNDHNMKAKKNQKKRKEPLQSAKALQSKLVKVYNDNELQWNTFTGDSTDGNSKKMSAMKDVCLCSFI